MQIRLFWLALFMGAGASFFIPSYALAKHEIQITATVLENITLVERNGKFKITTNYPGGYWQIYENQTQIVVARY